MNHYQRLLPQRGGGCCVDDGRVRLRRGDGDGDGDGEADESDADGWVILRIDSADIDEDINRCGEDATDDSDGVVAANCDDDRIGGAVAASN